MILWLLALGCSGPDGTDTGETGDTGDGPVWQVLADEIPGGTLLSAWEDQGETLMVGGQLDGTAGVIVRWDGDALCYEESVTDQPLWWMHGDGAGEWYAVGANGTILHSVAGSRTREDVPTSMTLFGVWRNDDGTVWSVAADRDENRGEIWYRDGDGTWSLALETPGRMFKVWDTLMVGEGIAYRVNGTTLEPMTLPDTNAYRTVRGASATDAWAVGGGGSAAIARLEGDTWTAVEGDPLCSGQPLNGVWTGPGEDVWTTGNFGTAARYADGAWSCADFPITSDHFHAIWPVGDAMWMVGGNLFQAGGNTGTIGAYGAPQATLTPEPCP